MNAKRLGRLGLCALIAGAPVLMGQRGGGCGGGGGGGDGGTAEIPDMSGQWTLTFNDDLSVEVDVAGTVYNPALGGGESTVTVTHDGQPITYNVDCSRELIVCPSELLPPVVTITQTRVNPRQVSVEITEQECRGEVAEGMCTGTVVERTTTRNGTITADGTGFTIILGGGVVVAGSCALLAISVANGDLVTSGSGSTLRADSIANGELITAFAGGCLVAGMADLDPGIEAAAVGATIQLRSTYTATRAP
jgi:hypothetical protein